MIVLDRIVNESEAPAIARRSEAALELAHELQAAKGRDAAPNLQRDVTGMAPHEFRSRTVTMARARAALAARTRASSTPARALAQIERELSHSTSHDPHLDMQV